jgi:hypothetical protein
MCQWELAQEQEGLELGQKERDRLKVLHEVEAGHLTQQQGAEQIKMSARGFRKLLARYRKKGDAGAGMAYVDASLTGPWMARRARRP